MMRFLPIVAGAATFLAPQWWLLRHPPLEALQDQIPDPGWFLNSGTAFSTIFLLLILGAALLTSLTDAVTRAAKAFTIGAITAMTATHVALGPSSLFPIVILLGGGTIIWAVIIGLVVGMAMRRVLQPG
jgi:peptidoglycan/LPS O-acetylase OafA/YrhL